MSVPQTRRRSSLSVTETQGIAYELILDYILTYPGSYPLRRPPMPLRSNSTRSRPQHPKQWSSSSRPLTPTLPRGSPALGTTSETPSPDVAAAAIFTATLLNQIGNSPSQPCSLPPIFTASFLRNCFPSELHLVDFPQALEGLEYLEHLNRRRRREVAGAKGRLGLRDGTTAEDAEGRKLCQGITAWLKDVENAERKAEALFTQLYVALRRWVSLLPLSRHVSRPAEGE